MKNIISLIITLLFLTAGYSQSKGTKIKPYVPPKAKRYKKEPSFYKDTSYLYMLNMKLGRNIFYQTKSITDVRNRYLRRESYIGGSRSSYLGRYDGFFGGYQYTLDKQHSSYGEIGFVSNRFMRPTYSTLHCPDFMYVTFAFNPKDNVYGLFFGAKQPLLRKEKSYNYFDLLYVGGEIRLFNNGTYTRRSVVPTVSISPPGRYFNNFLLTYGYDFFINGTEIKQVNRKHIVTIHYLFPNF